MTRSLLSFQLISRCLSIRHTTLITVVLSLRWPCRSQELLCVSVKPVDTNSSQLLHDTLNAFRSTTTTSTSMSSSFVLLVIVVMDSSSSTIVFVCLMLLKWSVHGEDELLLPSSPVLPTVETQYLTFDMSQYGPDGGVFSSKKSLCSTPSICLFCL